MKRCSTGRNITKNNKSYIFVDTFWSNSQRMFLSAKNCFQENCTFSKRSNLQIINAPELTTADRGKAGGGSKHLPYKYRSQVIDSPVKGSVGYNYAQPKTSERVGL